MTMMNALFVMQVANIYNVEKLKICKRCSRIKAQNLVGDRCLWTSPTEILAIYSISFYNSKFILTGLARRLVVCVSPNYLRLVDREHQTSGGDYHTQPSTRYHNCKIQMTTCTNTETENTRENIRSLEGITTLLNRQTQMILL